jgi:putative aminopeptidase FrvX
MDFWLSVAMLVKCSSNNHHNNTNHKKNMTPSMLDVGDDQSLYDHRMVEAIMTCTAKYKNEVSVGMRPM